MNGKLSLVLAFAGLLSACGSAAPQADASDLAASGLSVPEIVVMPSRGSTRPPRATPASAAIQPAGTAAVATGNGINYYGGPIMSGMVNLYYIWYGNWSGSTTPGILNDWGNNLNNSPIYRVNTTYSDNTGATVSGSTRLAGSTSPGYTHGTNLGDGDIWSIVNDALSAGKLPVDSNGVYFVLTSPDVNESSGYCTQYCGWHTANYRNNTPVKYSFIGAPSHCNGSCGGGGVSPNGDSNADGMASIMFHELSESVSDPLINAWSGPNGENGDLCAWNFGPTYKVSNGASANVHIGSRDYLLQQMWLNANGGSCQLSNPLTPPPTGASSPLKVGGYYELMSVNSGKCFDLPNASTADGATYDQKTCDQSNTQRFALWGGPNGTYFINNIGDWKCLELSNGALVQKTCSWSTAEQFYIENLGGSQMQIRNAAGNSCLDVNGGSTADGAHTGLWTCNSQMNQRWILRGITGELRDTSTGAAICVHPLGGATTPPGNTNAVLWNDCSTMDRIRYTLRNDGNLQHVSSGECLHPLGGVASAGTPLIFYPACGYASIAFKQLPNGAMQHKQTGLCLQRQNGSSANGTDIVFSTSCDTFSLDP